MIALARSKNIKSFMQKSRSASALACRYVGGAHAVEAVDMATHLRESNVKSSLFYLGEYVDQPELVDENLSSLNCLISMLAISNLEGHISVDPTQVGCSMHWDTGAAAFWPLAHALKMAVKDRPGHHCLMVDMEDDSVVTRTIRLHDALEEDNYPVAITLQAYLRRTEADLDKIIERGGRVRLVKGAFVAGPDIAYVGEAAIKNNYLKLADKMLSIRARNAGFYPIFGTHDHKIHDYVTQQAQMNGWDKGSYEIEMLYGARDTLAQKYAANGESIRLYLPFGKDWWPYAIRRIGENPKNAALLLRSLL